MQFMYFLIRFLCFVYFVLGYSLNSGNDYRNQNSNFFKPAGMPDIPEFPYKDSAFIPPLIPSSIHSGKFQNKIFES